LIERSLSAALGGEAAINFAPSGVMRHHRRHQGPGRSLTGSQHRRL